MGSPIGGGPVACAAAEATLRLLSEQKLWDNAAAMETLIRATVRFPALREIRGKGLLLGLVFDRPAKEIRDALLKKWILTGTSEDPSVLRLLPPLTLAPADVGLLETALDEILASSPAPAGR